MSTSVDFSPALSHPPSPAFPGSSMYWLLRRQTNQKGVGEKYTVVVVVFCLLYIWDTGASLAVGSSLADVTWRCLKLIYFVKILNFSVLKNNSNKDRHTLSLKVFGSPFPPLFFSFHSWNAHSAFKNLLRSSCLPFTSC